jgi:hypothetical protein
MKRVSVAAVLSLAMLAAIPTGVSAATTIGQSVIPNGTCVVDTTYIQSISPGQPYSAPFDGVITK